MDSNKFDLIIVGSGPAGLTAGIYASRANLKVLLLAGEQWGGQLMKTTVVENYPGFPEGINGPELMTKMKDQAEKFGTNIKYENVLSVDLNAQEKKVTTANGDYFARAVILATGSEPRTLGIPGEDKFYGRGVSTCATCDAAFFKDKIVAVVGGGDSAMEESTFLTRFASKVYLIHRRDEFRASPIMQERAKSNSKIEFMLNSEIKKIIGNEVVEKILVLNNKDNSQKEINVNGVFLAVGHIPVTGIFKDQLPLNDTGYVMPINAFSVKTNVKGVFIAGEIQDYIYKQAITTAADGCKAALEAQKFLAENE